MNKFAVGTKYIILNSPTSDEYTVIKEFRDSATDMRTVVGRINGETDMTLYSLEKDLKDKMIQIVK